MMYFIKQVGAHKKCKRKQISYFPIFPYFWYAMFECFPSTKMQKTFVLQFVLGSHKIWLDYYAIFS